MKKKLPDILEKARTNGIPGTNLPDGTFDLYIKKYGSFFIIASTGLGWDHVSVQRIQKGRKNRCPSWDEMCYIKDLFFDNEETVIQYHPKKSKYVNLHPFVLHLWKCQYIEFITPPMGCV